MSMLNFFISISSGATSILDILKSINTSLSNPIIPVNKDLTYFNTNNTNSQNWIKSMFDDGTYFWAFTSAQSDNIANQDLVYAARMLKTANLNQKWQMIETAGVPDVILPAGAGGSWDSWQVYSGNVVLNTDDIVGDGRTYIQYYGGYDNSGIKPTGNAYRIGIATSNDLITWTKYGSNPVFQDTNSDEFTVGNPFCKVIRKGANDYVMLYSGWINGGSSYMCMATSSDGLNWTVSQRKIFGGLQTPLIGDPTLINGKYYFTVAKTPSSGNDCDPTGTRITNGGPYQHIHIYSTVDFLTFVDEGLMFENQPEITEGVAPAGGFYQDNNGDWFTTLATYKWDIQKYNSIPQGEQFLESVIIRDSFSGFDTPNKVAYPNYVDYYDVTRLQERTGKGYVGTWGSSAQIDMINWIKPVSDYITFANRDIDIDNFGVKIKVYYPGNTFGNASEGQIIDIRDTDDNTRSIFTIYLNSGDLVVILWGSDGTIKKNYRTTNTIDNYVLPVANNDTVDIGFIFNAGTLKLCAGYTTDVPTTKTTDESLSQLNNSDEPLRIGGRKSNNNYANTNMTGAAFLLGSETTEANWLKLSLF